MSRSHVIEPWNNTLGTPQDASESYLRMREIAIQCLAKMNLDLRIALNTLDNSIDLVSMSHEGVPPSLDELHRTAQIIDYFARSQY